MAKASGWSETLTESASTVRNLNYQLKQLCRENRDGSYMTQSNRERLLALIANQLQELGYRGMGTHSLKPKHVEALVERWRGEGISVGSVKKRMSALRSWAGKIGRQNVGARLNEHCGIPEQSSSSGRASRGFGTRTCT